VQHHAHRNCVDGKPCVCVCACVCVCKHISDVTKGIQEMNKGNTLLKYRRVIEKIDNIT